MYRCKILCASAFAAGLASMPTFGRAAEFYIGEPVVEDDLQIVPNYLVGIEMDHMPPRGRRRHRAFASARRRAISLHG